MQKIKTIVNSWSLLACQQRINIKDKRDEKRFNRKGSKG